MAILKATNLDPKNSAIDIRNTNRFSWEAQGSAQTDYQVEIYNNDTDVLLHDSGKVTSTNEYYDLSATPITQISNGTNCKWQVTTHSGTESISSNFEFFITSATPIVTFTDPSFSATPLPKVIDTFQYTDVWTATNVATPIDDTVIYLSQYGEQSLKLEYDGSGSLMLADKDVSLDLTVFDNGIASTDNDYIYFVFYVSDVTKVWASQGVQIRFQTSTNNYYKYDCKTGNGLITGWNYYTILKSSFDINNSPDWSDITLIRLFWIEDTAVGGEKVSFQNIEMQSAGGELQANLSTQDYTFVCAYSQDENVSIKRYKFNLYDETGTTLIDTSNWVYDFNPSYEFTGMVNQTYYQVECLVTSQYDLQGETGKKTIFIDYDVPDDPPDIITTPDDFNGNMQIDWGNLKQVLGTCAGGYEFIEGKFERGIELSVTPLVYSEEFSDSDFTFTYWMKLQYGFDGNFMKIGDNQYVGYENSTKRFYFDDLGTKTYTDVITLYTWEDFGSTPWSSYSGSWLTVSFPDGDYCYTWFFIGLTSDYLIIKFNNDVRAQASL